MQPRPDIFKVILMDSSITLCGTGGELLPKYHKQCKSHVSKE